MIYYILAVLVTMFILIQIWSEGDEISCMNKADWQLLLFFSVLAPLGWVFMLLFLLDLSQDAIKAFGKALVKTRKFKNNA